MTSVPKLAWPLRLDGTRMATLEQDTVDEVAQCVELLLSTEPGQRLELPEYGVPPWLFTTTVDVDRVLAEVEEWEPRARVLLEVDHDRLDDLIRDVTVRVSTRGE